MARNESQPKKNESTRRIVRIGAGVVLILLVVLAFMDRSAKNAATETTTAWLDELQSAMDDNRELRVSDLSQHVIGSPETTGEASQGSVVYTWKGTLRSYETTIAIDGADQPVVMKIEGPSS
ncbi:MAG: hypothetical protein GY758_28315 [Fuerstiella sp.]|nr:hypothetical protein [Fuerstiella sp.]